MWLCVSVYVCIYKIMCVCVDVCSCVCMYVSILDPFHFGCPTILRPTLAHTRTSRPIPSTSTFRPTPRQDPWEWQEDWSGLRTISSCLLYHRNTVTATLTVPPLSSGRTVTVLLVPTTLDEGTVDGKPYRKTIPESPRSLLTTFVSSQNPHKSE